MREYDERVMGLSDVPDYMLPALLRWAITDAFQQPVRRAAAQRRARADRQAVSSLVNQARTERMEQRMRWLEEQAATQPFGEHRWHP